MLKLSNIILNISEFFTYQTDNDNIKVIFISWYQNYCRYVLHSLCVCTR